MNRYPYIILAGCVVVLIGLWFLSSESSTEEKEIKPIIAKSSSNPSKLATNPAQDDLSIVETQKSSESTGDTIESLFHSPITLTEEEIEPFLNSHHKSANSLLFAGKFDERYLLEAAELYPDNPSVQFAVLVCELLEDERMEWLQRFKDSNPDNAYANYFSAHEYFKTGQFDLAVNELRIAQNQLEMIDFFHESSMDSEEYLLELGVSELRAKGQSYFGMAAPQVSHILGLSKKLQAYAQSVLESGDVELANELIQYGTSLGNRLSQGDNSYAMINQGLGLAIEKDFLSFLDSGTANELYEQSVDVMLAQIEEEQSRLKDLTAKIDFENMTREEFVIFVDRAKVLGESAAMRWVIGRRN